MHPDEDVKTYSLLQTMALIISSCAHYTWGEGTRRESRRHAEDEGRRGEREHGGKVGDMQRTRGGGGRGNMEGK